MHRTVSLILLLASSILTATGGTAASTTAPRSPTSDACADLGEARAIVSVSLPPEVIDTPGCTPLAVYLLWRLEPRIGRQADAPSRAPRHPRHRSFRFAEDHPHAFAYEEAFAFFLPSDLHLEQLRAMPSHPGSWPPRWSTGGSPPWIGPPGRTATYAPWL